MWVGAPPERGRRRGPPPGKYGRRRGGRCPGAAGDGHPSRLSVPAGVILTEETPLQLVWCGRCCRFRRRDRRPAQALRDGPDACEGDKPQPALMQPASVALTPEATVELSTRTRNHTRSSIYLLRGRVGQEPPERWFGGRAPRRFRRFWATFGPAHRF